jgi:hypothetical protein
MELSAVDAAFVTGQSERTIRRHIANGYLPATKRRGVWRVALIDLRGRYAIRADRLAELLGSAPSPVLVQHLVQQPAPMVKPVKSITNNISDFFPNRAQAAQWLARHGVNVLNPKNWHGWREVELTPRTVMQLALSVQTTARWRIPWRLVRCDDETCVCQTMLV